MKERGCVPETQLANVNDAPSSTPLELLNHVQQVHTSYNPVRDTMGSHVEAYFREAALNKNDQTFIVEVFGGMHRYKKLLDVVNERLYGLRGCAPVRVTLRD